MAGLDVLYDCYDIMSAVLACEFEGLHSLHWGTAWMYRECPNGEWLVWSLGRAAMLLMWGFCTCACQIEGLHGDWLVVQNMENVEVMPRVFIPLK